MSFTNAVLQDLDSGFRCDADILFAKIRTVRRGFELSHIFKRLGELAKIELIKIFTAPHHSLAA